MTTLTLPPQLSLHPADAPLTMERTSDGQRLRIPPGCSVSLVEMYQDHRAEPYTTQSHVQVVLGERSRLVHYKVVHEGPQARHQSFLEVEVGTAAYFESHVFLFNGANIRNTIQARLTGEQAECTLNGLYVARGEQVVETHTLIDHCRAYGKSRELYKGILDGKAQGLFDGLIVVRKEAQKTDSSQTNKNLLLSNDAKAKSNPELKILANDVKCKHGATIGQIDETQLFYLRSRGIHELDARRVLISAFASEMIEPVAIPSLCETIEGLLHV